MTDHDPANSPGPAEPQQPYAPPPQAGPPPVRQEGYAPMPYNGPPTGKIRSTGVSIVLFIVTFGIYGLIWYFMVHDEMRRHTGRGIGGPIALILAFFVGIVMPYVSSAEVGGLYEARGQRKPVGAVTGLWYFPGILILVGPIIWFVKTNGALNAYWRSLGVR